MHAQYDAGFYDSIKDRAYTSALEIAPFIHRLIEPTSVVDIGCGSGDWLAVFQSLGVQDILGFDGGAGSEAALRIPREFFRSVDFRQPIPVDRTFDLALCLEVAEHLAATDARALVQTLARLAPVILFSAAVPQQPGVHHVNCRWPEYWVTEFAKLGYEVHDSVR
jgi:SAM-dependent methyltransferase